jgi:predicted tellurium resistance membrane protein TerC
MDTAFLLQYTVPILLVSVLEIALFSDNITALTTMTSLHSVENQKMLIRWALILGCPLNFGLIFLVIFLHDIPEIQDLVHLFLGLALIWVFSRGFQELASFEDEELAEIEEKNHVKLAFSVLVPTMFWLQAQSIPFYFDSVPLASSISHSIVVISAGIMISRILIILQADRIVDFFITHQNIQWGVVIFILFSGVEDLLKVVADMTHLFVAVDLNIPQELLLLICSVSIGLITWKWIHPTPKNEPTPDVIQ